MPYIVTTKRRHRASAFEVEHYELVSQRAIATLEEICEYVPGSFDTAIKIDGGTIGPLPDGTIVKVELVSKQRLRKRSGLPFRYHPGYPTPEIIDAFNARHA